MQLSTESFNGKIKLFADEEYQFTIDSAVFYSYDLRDGDEITPEELAQIKNDSESRRAYSAALRLLTLRAHAEKELRTKLSKKYNSEAVDFAVDKCRDLGFIDDEAFAHAYAEELHRKKHYSAARIKRELNFKGIDREMAEIAVEGLDISEIKAIIDLLNTKYSAASDEKQQRRAVAALVRLGYDYGSIRTAMREIGFGSEIIDE